jgi:hypothetical protein
MRVLVSGLALLSIALLVTLGAQAGGDKKDKEVTLKGSITCAKCDLKVEGQTKCATVIVAKKDKKEITFWFDAAAHKKYHGDICTEAKPGSVTGTVSKDGKKMVVAVKELKYD